ncbi:LysR family transcriptional regulator [Brevundimonas sp. SL130]|uniref:LysR family transcriptional regulator n=1 Tax=Brevundimonas sp. SL130 TaxID=2995143 RepID=UPI00226CB8EF|nr:LysR family transcriptional regulator [Brevundimonas sp. SL130]WAC61294.1 LysR family transcriptional regulator [Brevundimonas sp. SL130]
MSVADLNLLSVLDILLEERSVTRSAERLGISAPSVSRVLARLRQVTGDPLLVRAGRDLVPTARALELHDDVHRVVEDAAALLRPATLDLAALERRFTVRANDSFVGAFAGRLLARLRTEAPLVELRFAPEGESDDDALREGRIDLDIGALREMGPEVRIQTVFRDHFVGMARADHPIFDAPITPECFCQYDQISSSRRGRAHGPVDKALADLELKRRVVLIVPFPKTALAALPDTDLIAPVPNHVRRSVEAMGTHLRAFDLPLTLEPVVIGQAWHPRFDKDAGHQFLRQAVREICGSL